LTETNGSPVKVGKREPGRDQPPINVPAGGGGEEGRIETAREQEHIYKGKRISLEFSDSDIRLVFQKIARETNQNIVLDQGVQGKISLRLVDVPWNQALDIILEYQHLAILKEGNVLQIVRQKGYDPKKE